MARTWDGRDLTGVELLRAAATRARDRGQIATADLLNAAVFAFPIDPSEPPRHPLDRQVLLKCLALAAEVCRGS